MHLWGHMISAFLAGRAWRDRGTRTGEWPSSWVILPGSWVGLASP